MPCLREVTSPCVPIFCVGAERACDVLHRPPPFVLIVGDGHKGHARDVIDEDSERRQVGRDEGRSCIGDGVVVVIWLCYF